MLSFRTKVRKTTYLYGSNQLTAVDDNVAGDAILFVRVDDLGEPVTLFIRKRGNAQDERLGSLDPGQSFSLRVEKLQYVIATCVDERDSNVDCCLTTRKN